MHFADTAREHGCIVHTTHVHGPCSRLVCTDPKWHRHGMDWVDMPMPHSLRFLRLMQTRLVGHALSLPLPDSDSKAAVC